MGASLEIPKGLKTLLPASADARYLNEDDQPYVDLQQAYSQNPEGARTLGLTVNVDKTEYWWKDGLTNAHLVPKTSGIEFTTDESLYLDPVSHILRANLTTYVQTFDYISGPQVFTLLERPVRILYIWVQGVGIIKPSQRDINVSAKTITINDELDSGDIVTVCYSYVITEAIHPFITAAQVEEMLEGIDGASREDQLELIQDYSTIGTVIGDTQKDYNEKNQVIIAALIGNVPHPNYTPPTVSMTTPSALQKVGASYNVNLTLTYNQNDGGVITAEKIEKNSTQVSFTNTFSETLIVPIGITTYKGTVNYEQGAIKNNSIGIPDPVGRIPAGAKSVTKNIEGVYPLFGTTSNITVGTEQGLVSMQNANNVVLNLVGESGGNKQFFDIPQDWLDARALTKIEFFDFNTNDWNSQNQLSTFTAVANTHVVNGATIDYKRYTNNGSNRGSIRMRLIF